MAGPLAACGRSTPSPTRAGVVVVGAGLAGLTCAYRLQQRGVRALVYEANPNRIGGRCWTARGFTDGQLAEHGGEFIDSDHARLRALIRELDLQLEDRRVYAMQRSGLYSRLYIDGRLRDEDEVYRAYGRLRRRLRSAANRIGYFSGKYREGRARKFDRITARQWLDHNVPGGGDSLFGQAMRGYLANEFGSDAEQLGATNLFYVLEGDASTGGPAATDSSDERFHVHGGNDQVPRLVAERIRADQLQLDSPLEALWRRAGGSYGMRFRGVRGDVLADHVVLSIPFTTLREVDLERAELSRLKREAIQELGMGTNAKLLMQFNHRPAHHHGWNGSLSTDQPFLDTWDTAETQSGRAGLLTVYSGGAAGAAYHPREAHGPAPANAVRDALAALDLAVPGISRDFNGRAWLDDWAADPWVHGSYAAFTPGQLTKYQDSDAIARKEGGVHFCGEHTSIDYQGFLEGAVESGERCAREVVSARNALS